MEYLVLIVLWVLWCGIHSGMISLTIISYFKNRLGDYYKFYRLFYVLTSFVTLIPLILYGQRFKGPILFRWEGYMTMVQIALLIIVMFLFISGGLKYDLLRFFGIRQIKSGKLHSTLSESGEIDLSGILNLTRHPWYLGAIIFVWIDYRVMYLSTLLISIILTVYLVIGTLLEERKLIIELGDNYREYTERVPMLFPTKWIFSKILKILNAKSAG